MRQTTFPPITIKSPTLEAVVDWFARNPRGTVEQCAEVLGKNPKTIRLIVAADMNRVAIAQRRRALAN
jgi:hypothetical protein